MPATATPNNLDRVWSGLTRADRFALLGHDRDELSADDKTRLAGLVLAAQTPNKRRR